MVLVTENKQNYCNFTCCAAGMLQPVPNFLMQYFFHIASSTCTCCYSLRICNTFSISWVPEGLMDKEHVLLFIMYHCHLLLRDVNYSEIVAWCLLTLLELISMEATRRGDEYKRSKNLSALMVWKEHSLSILSFSTAEFSIKKLFVCIVAGVD